MNNWVKLKQEITLLLTLYKLKCDFDSALYSTSVKSNIAHVYCFSPSMQMEWQGQCEDIKADVNNNLRSVYQGQSFSFMHNVYIHYWSSVFALILIFLHSLTSWLITKVILWFFSILSLNCECLLWCSGEILSYMLALRN